MFNLVEYVKMHHFVEATHNNQSVLLGKQVVELHTNLMLVVDMVVEHHLLVHYAELQIGKNSYIQSIVMFIDRQ